MDSEYAAILFHRESRLLSREIVLQTVVESENKTSSIFFKLAPLSSHLENDVRLFPAWIFTDIFSKLKSQG